MSEFLHNDLFSNGSDPASETSESNSVDDGAYSGFFEGPEKTMEVVFRAGSGVDDGLRALTREQLDHLCTLAKCSILSKISSNYMDAYVLSESSLFIYRHKFIMKTCGTTTLLRCLNALLTLGDQLKLELESVVYSRKNLSNPEAQHYPHSSFDDEIKYINTHAKLQERLHGNGYILGPVTGDHWFVYCADLFPVKPTSSKLLDSTMPLLTTQPFVTPAVRSNHESLDNRTINMMMFDLAPDVCDIFFQRSYATGKEMTKRAGISNLCPGATIDETAFTPCGYSMNAILHDAYYTIHITPEATCSYASFETNTALSDYSAMVRNALTVFKPRRFVLTIFGHEQSLYGLAELPTDNRRIELPGVLGTYARTSVASTKVESQTVCLMACFSKLSEESLFLIPSTNSMVSLASGVGLTRTLSSKASLSSLTRQSADGRPRGSSFA